MTKRLFDIFFSSIGLIILSPLFLMVAISIMLDSKGPVFFRQKRVGKDFKEFRIYKFRTMVDEASLNGQQITVSGDKRVTRVGKFLRRHKIDELPQLINVSKGDMSFVGPRPEVGKYVEMFRTEYDKLLRVRPGITDPASIQYSDEEKILASATDWEKAYVERVLPEKIKLASQYVDKQSNILTDAILIIKTILKI
jgi:lipopolysaccharide/colanic/teichoic acid biosynthesis glycosyltransferase